jgi:hypothetical protein
MLISTFLSLRGDWVRLRPVSAETADTVLPSPIRSIISWVFLYATRRFHILLNAPAITLLFLCPYAIYSQVGRDATVSPAGAAVGAASYLLLFLQLRVADDLEDYDSDQRTDAPVATSRAGLWTLLAAAAALAAGLNLGSPPAAATVLAAAATIAGPVALKRKTTAPGWVVAACYEASPLLLSVYPYVAWRSTHAQGAGPRLVVSGTGLVWALYEYWKFSRSSDRGHARPHGLSATAVRLITLGLLGAICVCWASIFLLAPHPLPALIFALAVCAGPAWLISRRSGDRWVSWSGLVVAGTLAAYAITTTLVAN